MELTVISSESSWTQRQDEPLQCEEVLDVSDISVVNGDIKMTRVGGNDKCSDLGT